MNKIVILIVVLAIIGFAIFNRKSSEAFGGRYASTKVGGTFSKSKPYFSKFVPADNFADYRQNPRFERGSMTQLGQRKPAFSRPFTRSSMGATRQDGTLSARSILSRQERRRDLTRDLGSRSPIRNVDWARRGNSPVWRPPQPPGDGPVVEPPVWRPPQPPGDGPVIEPPVWRPPQPPGDGPIVRPPVWRPPPPPVTGPIVGPPHVIYPGGGPVVYQQPIYYPSGTPGTLVVYDQQAVPIVVNSENSTISGEERIGYLVNYLDQMYLPLFKLNTGDGSKNIYYTKSVDDTQTILGIYFNGINCTDPSGCIPLRSRDQVYIPQFDRTFYVSL